MAELRDTVASGDRVASLQRLRDYLAEQLERPGIDDRVIAPIAKRLEDVMRDLSALSPPKEDSAVDELSKRRSVRRKRAAASDGTASGEQRGRRSGRSAEGGEPAT